MRVRASDISKASNILTHNAILTGWQTFKLNPTTGRAVLFSLQKRKLLTSLNISQSPVRGAVGWSYCYNSSTSGVATRCIDWNLCTFAGEENVIAREDSNSDPTSIVMKNLRQNFASKSLQRHKTEQIFVRTRKDLHFRILELSGLGTPDI